MRKLCLVVAITIAAISTGCGGTSGGNDPYYYGGYDYGYTYSYYDPYYYYYY